MLRELRDNKLVIRQPWNKETIKGRCANKDCMKIAVKGSCERCGLKYCSASCQREDWKHRHKHHCEDKNIRRTEVIFRVHAMRLAEYTSGKTSIERYFSIAMTNCHKELFPSHEDRKNNVQYRTFSREENSGRILTVLEDIEIGKDRGVVIHRCGKHFLQNANIQSVSLTKEQEQERIEAGLTVRDAVELVPVNEDVQEACNETSMYMLARQMRKCKNIEENNLLLIELLVRPGMGQLYGNPIFLSLKNMMAYEDFLHKSSLASDTIKFPFDLCCSILFPGEYKLSMRTGNIEDDNEFLDVAIGTYGENENQLVDKCVAPSTMASNYAILFDEDVVSREEKEDRDAFIRLEGETDHEAYVRYYTHKCNTFPLWHQRLDLSVHCSESLAIIPANVACFTGEIEKECGEENIPLSDR